MDVTFDDHVQRLDLAFPHRIEHTLELSFLLSRQFDLFEFCLPVTGDFSGTALIRNNRKLIPRVGSAAQALNFNRGGGARRFCDLTRIARHRPNPSELSAGNDDVAFLQLAFLDEQRRHDPLTPIQARLHHGAGGNTLIRRAEVQHL